MFHFHTECSSRFPGKTDDGVAVGTVVGDFKFYNGVVVADHFVNILTHMAVFVIENPNAIHESLGQIVGCQTQFCDGAKHTIGFFAPELAFGDVYATR